MASTKLSELLSRPVIGAADGKTYGIAGNVLFDGSLSRIQGLIIFDTEEEREDGVVSVEDVDKLGDHAVFLKKDACFKDRAGVVINNPINSEIFDDNGRLFGKIKDVLLDGFETRSFIVANDLVVPPSAVLSNGKNVVIVASGCLNQQDAPAEKSQTTEEKNVAEAPPTTESDLPAHSAPIVPAADFNQPPATEKTEQSDTVPAATADAVIEAPTQKKSVASADVALKSEGADKPSPTADEDADTNPTWQKGGRKKADMLGGENFAAQKPKKPRPAVKTEKDGGETPVCNDIKKSEISSPQENSVTAVTSEKSAPPAQSKASALTSNTPRVVAKNPMPEKSDKPIADAPVIKPKPAASETLEDSKNLMRRVEAILPETAKPKPLPPAKPSAPVGNGVIKKAVKTPVKKTAAATAAPDGLLVKKAETARAETARIPSSAVRAALTDSTPRTRLYAAVPPSKTPSVPIASTPDQSTAKKEDLPKIVPISDMAQPFSATAENSQNGVAQPAAGREKAPEQKKQPPVLQEFDHIPARIIADYAFLLGRKVTQDIQDNDGGVVIKKGELILVNTVSRARKHSKLFELTIKSI